MDPGPVSYEEFWPYYVSQHSHPVNRALHFVGTTALLLGGAAALLVSPWWFATAPVAAYGFAWVGHFGFEKNTPATFTHPLWSLRADLRMYGLIWRGRMGPEIDRARERFPSRDRTGA
jgi:hypothetical protein